MEFSLFNKNVFYRARKRSSFYTFSFTLDVESNYYTYSHEIYIFCILLISCYFLASFLSKKSLLPLSLTKILLFYKMLQCQYLGRCVSKLPRGGKTSRWEARKEQFLSFKVLTLYNNLVFNQHFSNLWTNIHYN